MAARVALPMAEAAGAPGGRRSVSGAWLRLGLAVLAPPLPAADLPACLSQRRAWDSVFRRQPVGPSWRCDFGVCPVRLTRGPCAAQRPRTVPSPARRKLHA